jgi:DUF4097 and DUF4098 domain-containing protein YvlB
MKRLRPTLLGTLAGFLVVWHASAATTESNLEKSFAAMPGGKLVVDADQGDIRLMTGEADKVEILVKRKVKGTSTARAQEIFAAEDVTFDQDGARVEVRAQNKKEFHNLLSGWRLSFEQEFIISVPKRFDLNLRTGSGSIVCADHTANVVARSSGGDLRFGQIDGPVDCATGSGSIRLENVSGSVQAKTAGGDISAGTLRGDASLQTGSGSIRVGTAKARLTAKSNGGDLHMEELSGPAEVETGSGSITIKRAKQGVSARSNGGDIRAGGLSGQAQLYTGSGSIQVESAAAALSARTHGGDIRLGEASGSVDADTGSGSIEVKAAGGRVTLHSGGGDIRVYDARAGASAHTGSGSIHAVFSGPPSQDCELTSNGGDIEVKIAENVGFNVEARSGGGEVRTEVPVTASVVGRQPHDTLKGQINGGGKEVLVKTGSGSVTLKKL